MKIREFTQEQDLDYILSTFEDMFSSNKDFKPTKKGLNAFKEEILGLKEETGRTFILEEGGKQIGYFSFLIRYGEKTGVKKFILGKLYVNKEHRKKGYSRVLINKVKELAKENSCEAIELNSFESNWKLYKKLGFETVAYWMQM